MSQKLDELPMKRDGNIALVHLFFFPKKLGLNCWILMISTDDDDFSAKKNELFDPIHDGMMRK